MPYFGPNPSDGDKGDITVASGGTSWTIDNSVVSLAKLSATGTPGATNFLRGDNTWNPAVIGPGSATDNAITRYDLTTGSLVQNSAATIADGGEIRTTTDSGSNTCAVPLVNWIMLTADYTLTSTTSAQKAFNTTTNGTLTLPTGVYRFQCLLYLLSMSTTSGNLSFSPVGGGTAVTDRWGQQSTGHDNVTPTNANALSGGVSVTNSSPAPAVTAAANAGFQATFRGMFRVSTGGTIIPSISLTTAAAAVVKAGSYFWVEKVGESSETSVGAWT